MSSRIERLVRLIKKGLDFSGNSTAEKLNLSEDGEFLGIALRNIIDMELIEGGSGKIVGSIPPDMVEELADIQGGDFYEKADAFKLLKIRKK